MTIKRYTMEQSPYRSDHYYMEEGDSGDYVQSEDYDALAARLAEAERILRELVDTDADYEPPLPSVMESAERFLRTADNGSPRHVCNAPGFDPVEDWCAGCDESSRTPDSGDVARTLAERQVNMTETEAAALYGNMRALYRRSVDSAAPREVIDPSSNRPAWAIQRNGKTWLYPSRESAEKAMASDSADAGRPCEIWHDFDNGGTCKRCGWPFEKR